MCEQLLPANILRTFTVTEFHSLINGHTDVNLAAMRRTTVYTAPLTRKSQVRLKRSRVRCHAQSRSGALKQQNCPWRLQVVRWLWRCLASLTRSQRGLFLKFSTGTPGVLGDCITHTCAVASPSSTSLQFGCSRWLRPGTSRVPLDGFDPAFTLSQSEHLVDALPTAHTCFNHLVRTGWGALSFRTVGTTVTIQSTD